MYFAQEKTVFLRQLESQSASTVNIPQTPNPEILPKVEISDGQIFFGQVENLCRIVGFCRYLKKPSRHYISLGEKGVSFMIIVTVKNMFRFKAPKKYRFHRSDDNEGGSALSWKARFSGITKEVPCRAGRSGGLHF